MMLAGGGLEKSHLGQLCELYLLQGLEYVPSTQCHPSLFVHVADAVGCHPDPPFGTEAFILPAAGSVGR